MIQTSSTSNEAMAKQRARNVSDMTQQQRQHKRDLDRKAQRALRERNKNRIQVLEDELASLRTTMSEQSAAATASFAALREENMRLKQTLGRIGQLAISGELLDNAHAASPARSTRESESGVDDSTNVNARPTYSTDPDSSLQSSPRLNTDAERQHDQNHEPDSSEEHNRHPPSPEFIDAGLDNHTSSFETPNGDVEALTTASQDIAMSFPEEQSLPTQTDRTALGLSLSLHRDGTNGPPLERSLDHSSTKDYYLDGTRVIVHYDMSSQANATPRSSTNTHTSNQTDQQSSSLEGVWSFLPKHLPPTCPLDQILLDFLATRRSMSARGVAIESVLGPQEPSVLGLVTPSLAPTVHPVSRVMAEVLTTFPNVSITEKIGFMYKMHRTMRWQIEPTEENYRALPRWLQPTATQLAVPHAAWIDNIPWPSVRDILIQKSEVYPFPIFSEFYSQNVSVNWPYDPHDAFLHSSTNGKVDAVLNPVFEKRIRRLSNWTVSKHFERQMPEMYSAICSRD